MPTGIVGGGYFQVVGIPLVRGRTFDDNDRPTTRLVAIVNETMARTFWPGQDPIGKRARFLRAAYVEVVGVVKDSALGSIGAPPRPILYRPLTQVYQANVSILVRAKRPGTVLATVRQQIQQLDPGLPITSVMTLADALHQTLWATRIAASLLTVLGAVSLMLAIVGIYGVMAYSVSQRTQEIGLRLARSAPLQPTCSISCSARAFGCRSRASSSACSSRSAPHASSRAFCTAGTRTRPATRPGAASAGGSEPDEPSMGRLQNAGLRLLSSCEPPRPQGITVLT